MTKIAVPQDPQRTSLSAHEIHFFTRDDPFRRGAALSLGHAEELRRRKDMLGGLIKNALDQSVSDDILFRDRDGYLRLEWERALDNSFTPERVVELLNDLSEFMVASETMAALVNGQDLRTDGHSEAAEQASATLKILAQKRSVKGVPLADVFHQWMSRYARASAYEFTVAVSGREFRLRIPSVHRVETQISVLPHDPDRVLEKIGRAGARLKAYALFTPQGDSMVVPLSCIKGTPKRGATIRIRDGKTCRSQSVKVYRWTSKPVS